MRRAKYIQILRPTAREWEGELWVFQAGDEIAIDGCDVTEEPPMIPLRLACDLLRAHDAEPMALADLEEGAA